MAAVAEIVGGVLIAVGAFFFVTGAIGLYRMPDVFTRMHAAGISDTVGAALLLVGMMCFAGFSLVSVKLAIIMGVILFASPIATHALAQAALHAGIKPALADDDVMRGPRTKPVASSAEEEIDRAMDRDVKPPSAAKTARRARQAASRERKRGRPSKR